MLAIVEELLARDLVVLDRVDTDFFEGDALAGGFAGDIEGEVDGELIGVRAVKERTADLFAADDVVGLQRSDFWMTSVLPALFSQPFRNRTTSTSTSTTPLRSSPIRD